MTKSTCFAVAEMHRLPIVVISLLWCLS